MASNYVSKNICVYRLHRISFPCTSTVQTRTNTKTTNLSLTTSRNLWKIIYKAKRNAGLIVRDRLIKAGSQILFHPFQVSLIMCTLITTNSKKTWIWDTPNNIWLQFSCAVVTWLLDGPAYKLTPCHSFQFSGKCLYRTCFIMWAIIFQMNQEETLSLNLGKYVMFIICSKAHMFKGTYALQERKSWIW
jgi:hypothetical protein